MAAEEGEEVNQRPGEDHAQDGDDRENYGQQPKGALREFPGSGWGVTQSLGKNGNEGGAESAFSDQAAYEIWNLKSEDKGVRCG